MVGGGREGKQQHWDGEGKQKVALGWGGDTKSSSIWMGRYSLGLGTGQNKGINKPTLFFRIFIFKYKPTKIRATQNKTILVFQKNRREKQPQLWERKNRGKKEGKGEKGKRGKREKGKRGKGEKGKRGKGERGIGE